MQSKNRTRQLRAPPAGQTPFARVVMAASTATTSAITLKGSVAIVTEFFSALPPRHITSHATGRRPITLSALAVLSQTTASTPSCTSVGSIRPRRFDGCPSMGSQCSSPVMTSWSSAWASATHDPIAALTSWPLSLPDAARHARRQ